MHRSVLILRARCSPWTASAWRSSRLGGSFRNRSESFSRASKGFKRASKGLPSASKNFSFFPRIEDYQWLAGELKEKNRRPRRGAGGVARHRGERSLARSPARPIAYSACAACPRASRFSPFAARFTFARSAGALCASRTADADPRSPRRERIVNDARPLVKKNVGFFDDLQAGASAIGALRAALIRGACCRRQQASRSQRLGRQPFLELSALVLGRNAFGGSLFAAPLRVNAEIAP
jgi:hypothetical protein